MEDVTRHPSESINLAGTLDNKIRFPLEIENLCFEWSARTSPGFAPTLSVLCKHVQAWVEPVIYESLYIVRAGTAADAHWPYQPEQAQEERILPTLRSRPAEFFASNVHNLYISPEITLSFSQVALLKCTSVRHLTLHEARTLFPYFGAGSGSMMATSFTLSSLFTTKKALMEIITLGIELPNLSFLGIQSQGDKETISSLDWLPAVKTVELDLDKEDHRDLWKYDVVEVLKTTPQLQELWLDINPYSFKLEDIEKCIHRRDVPTHVTIYLRNVDVHYAWVLEWRVRIAGFWSYKYSDHCDNRSLFPPKRVVDCECSCWEIDDGSDEEFLLI